MAEPIARTREDQRILWRLDALLQQRPELADAIAFYRGALPALHVAGAAVVPVEYSPEAARRKIAAGIPVLVGEDLPFDPPTLLALFSILCRVAEAIPPDMATSGRSGNTSSAPSIGAGLWDAAADIRQAADLGRLDLTAIVAAVAAGNIARIKTVAGELKLDAGLLSMLVQNTLKPTLRAWTQSLAGSVDLSIWTQGLCPFCGSWPVLAELEETNGSRCLRCGLCSAGWSYPSSQCAFCGNTRPEALSYFTLADEEEQHYVQGCAECSGYLKTVLTVGPLGPDFLITEDLATMHLDALASEHGFTHHPDVKAIHET